MSTWSATSSRRRPAGRRSSTRCSSTPRATSTGCRAARSRSSTSRPSPPSSWPPTRSGAWRARAELSRRTPARARGRRRARARGESYCHLKTTLLAPRKTQVRQPPHSFAPAAPCSSRAAAAAAGTHTDVAVAFAVDLDARRGGRVRLRGNQSTRGSACAATSSSPKSGGRSTCEIGGVVRRARAGRSLLWV